VDVAKTLAGMDQNERCFRRRFFVAGAVFGSLGRRVERVEDRVLSNLICNMMMIPCGTRSTSDASGSFFVAGAALCRPGPKSG